MITISSHWIKDYTLATLCQQTGCIACGNYAAWMETKHGRIVSVPYCFETNDSVIYAVEKHSSSEMIDVI